MKQALQNFRENFELAARIAVFIVTLAVGVVILIAGTKAALAASLRTEAVITGDYIKLGDIFDGAKNADYILGPAPQPGKDMILNARTLYKIASSLDVDWSPSSSAEQIIVRREATIIPETDIRDALEEKIASEGVGQKFSLTFTNAPARLILPFGAEPAMDITAFSFNPQNDTFSAVIVAPSAENPVRRAAVSGRIERLVAVPVLTSTLKSGDIIGAADIDYIDMPQSNLPNTILLSDKDIINMTPRRVVNGGKPITVNDLQQPTMVERGEAITIIFENGPLVLTAKGKSLQAGAMGDSVRIANTDSNKNLQGIVTAHREVTVR
jgi:flagella basal body P-ring formation protein FlgA